MSVAVCFFAAALAIPKILAPLNKFWASFGLLLSRIVSPISLGILYFFAVTPVGLIMRLFGQSSLQLEFDKDVKSYWIERTPPGPTPESLKNQF